MSADDAALTRQLIREELDAANSYEQKAEATDDPKAREIYTDIAREEKVHAGELSELLADQDPETAEAQKEGMKEVKDFSKSVPTFAEMFADHRCAVLKETGKMTDEDLYAFRKSIFKKAGDDEYVLTEEQKKAEETAKTNKAKQDQLNAWADSEAEKAFETPAEAKAKAGLNSPENRQIQEKAYRQGDLPVSTLSGDDPGKFARLAGKGKKLRENDAKIERALRDKGGNGGEIHETKDYTIIDDKPRSPPKKVSTPEEFPAGRDPKKMEIDAEIADDTAELKEYHDVREIYNELCKMYPPETEQQREELVQEARKRYFDNRYKAHIAKLMRGSDKGKEFRAEPPSTGSAKSLLNRIAEMDDRR